jgi:hypothetical protein
MQPTVQRSLGRTRAAVLRMRKLRRIDVFPTEVPTVCEKCWLPYRAKKNAEQLAKAKEVKDYAGPVIHNYKYYYSLDDLRDGLDGSELPEFVHTCHVCHWTLVADQILENLQSEATLEDGPEFSGVKEFEVAVETFNKANASLEYWEEDPKHKVRVTP